MKLAIAAWLLAIAIVGAIAFAVVALDHTVYITSTF